MKKRGISPIIASVLLILLVVSLFSAVGYFLRKGPERAMEKGSEMFEKIFDCNDVNLEIGEVCYDKKYLYPSSNKEGIRVGIAIKNNNNFELDQFILKFSSGDNMRTDFVFPPDIEAIAPYGAGKIWGGSSDITEDINWVKLYPIINGKTCSSKEYKINMIGIEKC